MKWINALLAKINGVSVEDVNSQEPTLDHSDAERVIGVLPEELRRFHAYRGKLIDEFNKLANEHRLLHKNPKHTEKECEEFSKKASPMHEEIELLGTIFWNSIRAEFGAEDVKSLGLRHGWTLVECPPSDEKEESGLSGFGIIIASSMPSFPFEKKRN